jgi:hypothetical protein
LGYKTKINEIYLCGLPPLAKFTSVAVQWPASRENPSFWACPLYVFRCSQFSGSEKVSTNENPALCAGVLLAIKNPKQGFCCNPFELTGRPLSDTLQPISAATLLHRTFTGGCFRALDFMLEKGQNLPAG